jgi:hypothetical protein
MGAETLSNQQRAAMFNKVLEKSSTYEQQSAEDLYQMYIRFGMGHSLAYDLISFSLENTTGQATP